jgi:DNA-binding PadR family transcriptional regulator
MPENETLQSLVTELRRGTLTLAVLGALRKPRYGYALLQTMQQENIESKPIHSIRC